MDWTCKLNVLFGVAWTATWTFLVCGTSLKSPTLSCPIMGGQPLLYKLKGLTTGPSPSMVVDLYNLSTPSYISIPKLQCLSSQKNNNGIQEEFLNQFTKFKLRHCSPLREVRTSIIFQEKKISMKVPINVRDVGLVLQHKAPLTFVVID